VFTGKVGHSVCCWWNWLGQTPCTAHLGFVHVGWVKLSTGCGNVCSLSSCLSVGRQSSLVVSKLNSQSKGCGFKSRLIHKYYMEMGSKPCQDRFIHPILVHLNIRKKTGSQIKYLKNCLPVCRLRPSSSSVERTANRSWRWSWLGIQSEVSDPENRNLRRDSSPRCSRTRRHPLHSKWKMSNRMELKMDKVKMRQKARTFLFF